MTNIKLTDYQLIYNSIWNSLSFLHGHELNSPHSFFY